MTRTEDVDRTIALNLFLVHFYWQDRSPWLLACACARHLQLVAMRALVSAEEVSNGID